MKVGYVGLGTMGGALARWLVEDFELQVFDLSAKSVAAMVEKGAVAAASLADMARDCEVVVLCLPRSANVHQALFGPGGLAEGLTAGKIIVDQTSGLPSETRTMANALEKNGVYMVDAPVAGGVPSALARKITIMASGPDAAFEKTMPVLEAISPKVIRCSERVGDGQAVKLVNNAINAGYRVATLELAAFALKAGISLDLFAEALNSGPGASFSSKVLLPAVIENRSSTDFALALMLKDINQALALADETGVPMPIGQLARVAMQIGVNTLGPDARLDDVVPLIGSFSGVDFSFMPADAEMTAEKARLLTQIGNAVALCNMVVVLENVAMGARFGLDIPVLFDVVNAGSGWSAEAERLLQVLTSQTATGSGSLRDALADLDTVSRQGVALGVPLIVLNEVRAILRAWQNEAGAGASLDTLTAACERAADVRLRPLQVAV
ncbi:NAD-binding protein [uncultured Martelella sp.]|uniref:NAD-binding protein n=1 Tax=uncultured Martelella sp. TaxID=392331 RepID=UPI0029C70A5E|nr:NAD-binding protein [uncultured Martelella sp.]